MSKSKVKPGAAVRLDRARKYGLTPAKVAKAKGRKASARSGRCPSMPVITPLVKMLQEICSIGFEGCKMKGLSSVRIGGGRPPKKLKALRSYRFDKMVDAKKFVKFLSKYDADQYGFKIHVDSPDQVCCYGCFVHVEYFAK